MTGFGKMQVIVANGHLDIELKTVNHRFLDIQCRLPREFNGYEMAMRQIIKATINRGRVECFINYQKDTNQGKELKINWSLFDSLVSEVDEVLKKDYQGMNLQLGQVIDGIGRHSDFFEVVERQTDDLDFEKTILMTLAQALEHLNLNRDHEGRQIQRVLTSYSVELELVLMEIKKLSISYESEYQTKLTNKITSLIGSEVDESRLLTEVAILIEKGDIQEELDRLEIHLKKMLNLLEQEHAVGRELDFLIQEMNREINTIGSKSAEITIKNGVIKMKTILEKIREQIQNVE